MYKKKSVLYVTILQHNKSVCHIQQKCRRIIQATRPTLAERKKIFVLTQRI